MCRAPGFASAGFYATGDGLRRARQTPRLQSRRLHLLRHVRPYPTSAPAVASPATIVTISSLDQEGRGIARVDGKAVFVEGGLPGETVAITTLKKKPTFDLARADAVLKSNAARVEPRCPHFGVCGGCSQQHFDAAAQVAAKQRTLEDALWRLGRVRPALLLPPIHGPAWEYRHRARLSVRHVVKKGGMLIGFHERKSSYVADMTSCAVLPRKISDLLPKLRALIGGLSDARPLAADRIGGGRRPAGGPCAGAAYPRSRSRPRTSPRCAAFAEAHGVQFYLQPGGPATATPLSPAQPPLAYVLPEFDLRFPYSPTEFTQVNPAINRVLVRRAVALLDPRPGERIADFFCGIGNFTLPIARRGAHGRRRRGQCCARRARRRDRRTATDSRANATFHVANLFAATPESLEVAGTARQDPRRSAARRRDRAGQGAAGRRRAAADRLRLVQSGDARARRVGAGARPRLRPRGGGRDQHVSAHVARRIDRAVRALKSRREQSNRGDLRRPDAIAKASRAASVALPGKDQQQVEQADEDVVHAEEQVQRGHHVVRLAAAHDVGEVVQQVEREDQDRHRGDRHRQRRDLEEDVGERRRR